MKKNCIAFTVSMVTAAILVYFTKLARTLLGNQLTNFYGIFSLLSHFYYLKESKANAICNFCFVLLVRPTKCGEMSHFQEKVLK